MSAMSSRWTNRDDTSCILLYITSLHGRVSMVSLGIQSAWSLDGEERNDEKLNIRTHEAQVTIIP